MRSACTGNAVDVQSGLLLYDAYCDAAYSPSSCAGFAPVSVAVTLPPTAPAVLSISDYFGDAPRSCVTEAFDLWAGGGLWNGALMCAQDANGAFLNDCVCRPDLLSVGEGYISSVVKAGCSGDQVDVQSALAIYDSYCATAAPATAPAWTTPASPGQGVTGSVPSPTSQCKLPVPGSAPSFSWAARLSAETCSIQLVPLARALLYLRVVLTLLLTLS